MGKRRGGKKGGNPKKNFKVVGSKSLKAKKKTKPVKMGLKKANKEAVKQKLQEVDQQLVTVQDKVVEKPEVKKNKRSRKGKNQRAKMAKEKLTEETNKAIDKMEAMDV